MIINFICHSAKDLIRTDLKVNLYEAIEIINQYQHNGFNSWYWDNNLNLVIVKNELLKLNESYYYTLTDSETILIAKNYQNQIYPGV